MLFEKVKAKTSGIERKKILLFCGLLLLTLSGVSFLAHLAPIISLSLLGGGICLKMLFIIELFRAPDFKMSYEIYMILGGVMLILVSLIFKNIYTVPFLRNILFYTAIILKITGVCLLFFNKRK